MQVTVFGQTDKRPVIYTLMKIFETMGDTCVITNNRMYMRLMEDGPGAQGMYRNVTICVTDATADEMWDDVDLAPDDFEFVILDNLYNEDTNLLLYVQGGGWEADDLYLFDMFEEMVLIQMGKPVKTRPEDVIEDTAEEGEEGEPAPKKPAPKKGFGKRGGKPQPKKSKRPTYLIPYSKDMMANIEKTEFFRMLCPASNEAATVVAKVLSKPLKMPVKDLVKVAGGK